MRRFAVLLCLALPAPAAPDADEYFEIGLDYLRKGFYAQARAAFAESLVRAPGECVPTVFLGLAAAAEGRPAGTCARLIRAGHAALPAGRVLRLDIARQLPSVAALQMLHEDFARRLPHAAGRGRRDHLAVLAFLEAYDPGRSDAPSLDLLRDEAPDDALALALGRARRSATRLPEAA